MVELTARFQFYGPHPNRIGFSLIFHEAHIPLLKPLFENKTIFYLHGTLGEGLRFDNSEVIQYSHAGSRLTLYNKSCFKISALMSERHIKPLPKPTELKEIKVNWDAKRKAFLLPPIDVKELTTRSVRNVVRKAAAVTGAAPPAKQGVAALPTAATGSLETLRSSLRLVNQMATELGIELSLENGRVRAILTFE